jgi:spore coat polysaccharide biosynthesis protein SpsF
MNVPAFDVILACRVIGTRLYGKPLQLLDIEKKITILEHLVKYIKTSHYLNSVCLAISDEKENFGFIEMAEKNGWRYILGDPSDVLGRILKAVDAFDTNTVLRATTENPFVVYDLIDTLFERHRTGDYDYSMFSNLPDGVGVSLIKAEALRISHKRGTNRHRSELVTSYIFDHKDEFKLNIQTPEAKLRRPEVRITVDYPEDLIFCRKVYRDLNGYEKLIKITEIIDYWDQNEEIRRPVERIGVDWGHGRLWA